MGQYTSYGKLAAATGLVGVTFEHRFTGGGEIARAAEDVQAALRFIRENAADLSIDSDRVCLWSFSAGGLFVAPLLRERPNSIRCVLLYYAVVDPGTLSRLGGEGVPDEFTGQGSIESLLSTIPDAVPPMLVARAGQDYAPIREALDRLTGAALRTNLSLEVVNHPRGQHAFVLVNDDERSRQIIRRSLAFVRSFTSMR